MIIQLIAVYEETCEVSFFLLRNLIHINDRTLSSLHLNVVQNDKSRMAFSNKQVLITVK